MSQLRVAVIGGGHLGAIHARLLQQVPTAQLVVIGEPSQARAVELAQDFTCAIETDISRLIDSNDFDAAVVASPTIYHHQVGMQLLQRGIHTLIEKPLAPTRDECHELVVEADRHGCVLQVGHVERFNPIWSVLRNSVGQPTYIEAVREGLLTFRSMDAGVVLDLMIHDIDLILAWVNSPVVSVESLGFNWTGPTEDIAQARLTFANGCIAQLRSSRVACGPKRRLQAYGESWYAEVDFGDRTGHVVRAPVDSNWQSRGYTPQQRQQLSDRLFEDVLFREELAAPATNAILDELQDFVTSIATKSSPIVSGHDGLAAVEIARCVIDRIEGQGGQSVKLRPAA